MPRHRNIEEEFRAIAPKGQRGIPLAQPIAVGVTGLSLSMSQPSQEIAQLEAQFQQQSGFLQSNTQTSSQNSSAGTNLLGHVTGGSGLGGGLGLLSPVITGLLSLFGVGGSSDAPPPLPFYTAPPSVDISDTLRNAATASTQPGAAPAGGSSGANSSATPQVTVQVSAMDSQSIMDRSSDIASAVREAMLNLHPINDVVASL